MYKGVVSPFLTFKFYDRPIQVEENKYNKMTKQFLMYYDYIPQEIYLYESMQKGKSLLISYDDI
jgi:hypothetical protein